VTVGLKLLAEGIEQVNRDYIQDPTLSIENYRALISEMIIDHLLAALGEDVEDLKSFGFYSDPAIGYTGYLKLGEQVLFFGPTKTVISERAPGNGELSPYGELP
jgi:hypothetical protein